MAKSCMIGVTFTALTITWAAAEFFTAIGHIQPLLDSHQSVIDKLETYINTEVERLKIMGKFLSNFKREQKKMQEENDYVGNPINTYTLIKRLTADLESIEYYAKLHSEFERSKDVVFPDKEDLEGAATALWRLQRMYALNVSELAAGRLEGRYSHEKQLYVENTFPMSVSDCFEIGRVLYAQQDYNNTVLWMQEALNKYEKNDPNEPYVFDEAYLLDYLRHAYHGVGNFGNAISYTKRLAELRPHFDYTENLLEYEKLSKEANNVLVPPTYLEDQDIAFMSPEAKKKYRALCRGDLPLPEDERKNLYCYFKANTAYLLLAPIKVELLHQDPVVYLFHDVISDQEITHIQQLAQPALRRATVNDKGEVIATSYRISKSAWFSDADSAVAARLSYRATDMSGLSTSYAESLQVANYGIGGHYDPHFDFLGDTNFTSSYGNRIATILFYMSDVEQGGATVFMDLELTVFPKKHSAIMWYNMLQSGEPDYRTNHAACPVLRGSKWVSNKWLHEFGQEFLRPCNLQYEENRSQTRY